MGFVLTGGGEVLGWWWINYSWLMFSNKHNLQQLIKDSGTMFKVYSLIIFMQSIINNWTWKKIRRMFEIGKGGK